MINSYNSDKKINAKIKVTLVLEGTINVIVKTHLLPKFSFFFPQILK